MGARWIFRLRSWARHCQQAIHCARQSSAGQIPHAYFWLHTEVSNPSRVRGHGIACKQGAPQGGLHPFSVLLLFAHQRNKIDAPCSPTGQDCRSTGCCAGPGLACYEKDQWWASCRSDCVAGEINPDDPPEYRTPWSCLLLS